MRTETVIYEPPKDGLPYLVVTIGPDGLTVVSADSRTHARKLTSEQVMQRRKQEKESNHVALQPS